MRAELEAIRALGSEPISIDVRLSAPSAKAIAKEVQAAVAGTPVTPAKAGRGANGRLTSTATSTAAGGIESQVIRDLAGAVKALTERMGKPLEVTQAKIGGGTKGEEALVRAAQTLESMAKRLGGGGGGGGTME